MARMLVSAAFLFIVVTGPSGCAQSARLVHKEAGGGIVAIPENTDVWPTYHRSTAIKKIRDEHAPNFDPMTDIVGEGEVVIGQQTLSNQRTENRKLGPDGKPLGDLTTSQNTTTTTDKKEYRIQYQVKSTLIGNGPANNSLVPAGGIHKPNDGLAPSGRPLDGRPVNVDPRTGLPVSSFQNLNNR